METACWVSLAASLDLWQLIRGRSGPQRNQSIGQEHIGFLKGGIFIHKKYFASSPLVGLVSFSYYTFYYNAVILWRLKVIITVSEETIMSIKNALGGSAGIVPDLSLGNLHHSVVSIDGLTVTQQQRQPSRSAPRLLHSPRCRRYT